MRRGWRSRQVWRWCSSWWRARSWEMRSRTRSILQREIRPGGRRQVAEDGLIHFVTPVEGDLLVGNAVLAQPGGDRLDDFRGEELVRAPVHEGRPGRAQPCPGRFARQVEIGRELPAPQDQPVHPRLPHRRPAADGRRTLGETQRVHGHPRPIERSENVRVDRVEILHVILDLGQAVLARHPARADAALGGTLTEVEPGQAFGGDEQAVAVVEDSELFEEAGRQLAVAVTRKPHLARLAAAEREVSRHARDGEVMLLHRHVTRIVTISCGSATNRTVLPRPSSTRATDSRSSARTRWALFTPSPAPKRHAPATLRSVTLQQRSTRGEPCCAGLTAES